MRSGASSHSSPELDERRKKMSNAPKVLSDQATNTFAPSAAITGSKLFERPSSSSSRSRSSGWTQVSPWVDETL
jgi:hypothetical protein